MVKPLVDDWSEKANAQYQSNLGPYVDRAQQAAYPQVERARKVASEQYETILVPSYEKALPYARSAYGRTQKFIIVYGLPYSRFALDTSTTFITRKVWPPIRILYGQNVEPQLFKIKERLVSYREGKRIEAAVDEVDEPSSGMTASTSPSAGASSSVATDAKSSQTPAREDVTEELKHWQAKFVKAADKGGEDLARRVSDITSSHISTQVDGTGSALVTQLEDACTSAQDDLKSTIIDTISSLPEDPTPQDQNAAFDTIRTAIRTHGNIIKDQAQELRLWKLQSNDHLTALLTQASASTLSVLDSIRDLGLQEIGMRWAASDHVTYDDWTAYHALKQSFHDWRVTVADVATDHDSLSSAHAAADALEDKGMALAQEAAENLARLKDVARWKIEAHDTSDDFANRKLPAAAARIGQKIVKQAGSAVSAATASSSSQQGLAESIISAATASAASAASDASSALSQASDSASSAASDASSAADASVSSLSAEATSATHVGGEEAAASSSSSLFSAVSYASTDTDAAASAASSMAHSLAQKARSVTSEVLSPDVGISYSHAATVAAGSAASMASSLASVSDEDIRSKLEEAEEAARETLEAVVSPQDKEEELRSRVADAKVKISRGVDEGRDDVVSGARSVSESIASLVSEAGWEYATVTQTLQEAVTADAGATVGAGVRA